MTRLGPRTLTVRLQPFWKPRPTAEVPTHWVLPSGRQREELATTPGVRPVAHPECPVGVTNRPSRCLSLGLGSCMWSPWEPGIQGVCVCD